MFASLLVVDVKVEHFSSPMLWHSLSRVLQFSQLATG
jgi:hypothetical protein